jgi:CTP synthase (UTP-ammonia lyase)
MMITNDITHVSDVTTTYGKAPLLSKEEIEKIVENSQRIEGYKPASKEYEDKVEAFMQEHNVKVSA